jgi:SAM-dependent methyltransferase
MNANPPSDLFDATVRYYAEHAEDFAKRTKDIDMSPLYDAFLPLVPKGGAILDAGCGSGRDSEAFIERGYSVMACDASKAMVDIASARIGQPVLHLAFAQFDFDKEFDGIWACASLLHVPKSEMATTFASLHRALKPEGVLYASFKRGSGEELREGRLFNDYDEESLAAFVNDQTSWALIKLWRTDDIGQCRAGVEWVNLVLRAKWRP